MEATADDKLVCRLSDQDVLVLAAVGGVKYPRRRSLSVDEATAWSVPRRDNHCWFVLRGPDAPACLQKLCGVDLRLHGVGPGSIAQISTARLNGLVCRSPMSADEFHILADSASAVWFWDVLLDAAEEFGGGPLGLSEALDAAS